MARTVNITIVTHNRLNLTRTTIDSLLPTLTPDVSVTVVDNNSTDGTPAYLERLAASVPSLKVIPLPRNMGVAVAANLGWAGTDADHYLKLDNDVELLRTDWLEQLVSLVEGAPEVGMASYRFLDRHEVSPVTLSSGKTFLSSRGIAGACAIIPRRVHAICGFWTEDYGRYGYEDLDYSNRVRQCGMLVGYLDIDDAARHLGAVRDVDARREEIKRTAISSKASGEPMYLLNKFLFEQGIRDIYVKRRYLPDFSGPKPRFVLDEACRPIMRLQREMLAKTAYSVDGDVVSFDLSKLKR
jgi:glycosyltransferase involved in cell wall biosynthesis